jgi:mevalonate kinase
MAENLGLALAELFGSNILTEAGLTDLTAGLTSSAPVVLSTTPTADLSNATVEQLITRANDAFNQAQAALRDGDWTTYGVQMEIVQSALQQLAQLSTPAAGSQ